MSKQFRLFALIVPLLLGFSFLSSAAVMASGNSNPYGPATIDPAAPNAIILKLSKGPKYVTFTLEQLKALKGSIITIYEPFIKKKQSFQVIPLSDLFKTVGIVGKDKVQTLALNDYLYTNTAANFISASGFLAIQRDGLDIPYDRGGPIRIIFPDKSKWHKFLDPWNWSLKAITVK